MKGNIVAAVAIFLVVALLAFGWARQESNPRIIRMAATTSMENSGLLDVLLPAFRKRTSIEVHAVAVGTGKALKLGENGDVDLLMVHAPELEKEFVANAFGVDKKPVFYNYFIVVGAKEDPAAVRNAGKVSEAFCKIAEGNFTFISRGDNSGTHKKEMEIWKRAGISPKGPWYMETGQGMGATLKIADEKRGYCLIDRGTFMTFEDKVDLEVVFEGGRFLKNPYAVIIVNPDRHPHTKYKEAKIFSDWVVSGEGSAVVSGFTKKGKELFHTFD